MEALQNLLALSLGAGWASGINLYATVLMLGFLELGGDVTLPTDLDILTHPLILLIASILYFIEFFADKIPGIDTLWDSIQTFIRIPAGALLAGGVFGDWGLLPEAIATLVGGGLAASSHATKAGSRVMINTSPEPFTNWIASIGEDIAVVAGLWTALMYPELFLLLLLLVVIIMIWLLPKLAKALIHLGLTLKRLIYSRFEKT